jgi:hypothetical protein
MRAHSVTLCIFAAILLGGVTCNLIGLEISPVPAPAVRRLASVRVQVAPDRTDWTYAPGEPVSFRIQVTADGHPIEGASVSYTVAPESTRAERITAAVPTAGLVIHAGAMHAPGFLRCIVETEISRRKYRGLATAACAPERIEPGQSEPADFDAFWEQGRIQLARVPLAPEIALLPEACTEKLTW